MKETNENRVENPTTIQVSSSFREELADNIPKSLTYEEFLKKEINLGD